MLASPLFPESFTFRRLQHSRGAATTVVTASTGRLRPRLLGQSLLDDGDTIATIASTTINTSSMVVYDIPADTLTSAAITVATLTFGQAQLLLSEATALEDEVLAIAAVAVCGNGVCELGERPNATAAGVNATGQCKTTRFLHCNLDRECNICRYTANCSQGQWSSCGRRSLCHTNTHTRATALQRLLLSIPSCQGGIECSC